MSGDDSDDRSHRRLLGLVAAGAAAMLLVAVLIVVVAQRGRAGQKAAEGAKVPAAPAPAAAGALAQAALSVALVVAAVGAAAYALFVLWAFTWVVRDADCRGHVGALWGIIYIAPQMSAVSGAALTLPLIFLGVPVLSLAAGWTGLALYRFSRRPGILLPCRHCSNRRLDYAAACPHCGRA